MRTLRRSFLSLPLLLTLACSNHAPGESDRVSKVSRALTLRDIDYDGDGRADYLYYHEAFGAAAPDPHWTIRKSSGGADVKVSFGGPNDSLVPADYDGDGKLDLAIYLSYAGVWKIRPSSGASEYEVELGQLTDRLVPADYDGDGKADPALYRPSTGEWIVRRSGGGADTSVRFGDDADVAVPSDYDGDGKADYAVYRAAEGKWYVRPSSGGNDIVTSFGTATDVAVPADYDGDGKADRAFFRPSTGTWNIRRSTGGDTSTQFGVATDVVLPNDYDGDGKADLSVYRPGDKKWFVRPSRGGGDLVQSFSETADVIPYSRTAAVASSCPEKVADTKGQCEPLLWPNGRVAYEIDAGVGPNLKQMILESMADWSARSGGRITFVEDRNAKPRLYLRTNPSAQSCSAYHPNADKITCQYYAIPDSGWNTNDLGQQGIVSHEIGHGIGLSHEHLRSDRDRYVTVDSARFNCSTSSHWFDNWKKCGADDSGSDFGPYDYESVFQYASTYYKIYTSDNTNHVYEPAVNVNSYSQPLSLRDGSDAAEQYAYEWGWKKFSPLGFDRGPRLRLSAELAPGVVAAGSPSITSAGGRGLLDFVVRGTDGKLYQRGALNAVWDNRYLELGGSPWHTDPAAGSIGAGSMIVAAGASKNIWVKEYSAGAWRTWVNLSGPTGVGSACSAPAIASDTATTTRLYVLGCDNKVYYRTRAALGSWSAWALSGSAPANVQFAGKPAVAVRPGRHFEVLVPSSTNMLYHQTDGGPFTLRAVGLAPGSSAAISASASGRIDIVYRNADNAAQWMNKEFGAWSVSLPIGGLLASDPTLVSGYTDHVDALALLEDGQLWHRSFTRSRRTLLQDYSFDNRDDLVYFSPSDGVWNYSRLTLQPDGTNFLVAGSKAFGVATDRVVPADYDGDGFTDLAVFRPSDSNWYIRPTSGGADRVVQFGVQTDRQVPADYDADGKADLAVFRPSEGKWYIRPSFGGSDMVIPFGVDSDKQLPGDYDGDGAADVAVFRPSEGKWYVHPAKGGSDLVVQFGASTDRPVPADYDGDGRMDFAVFRPSEGKWYVRPSSGQADIVTQFGVSSDRLVPADYDMDGKVDLAVFRPSEGKWYIRPSHGGPDLVQQFGSSSSVIPYSK